MAGASFISQRFGRPQDASRDIRGYYAAFTVNVITTDSLWWIRPRHRATLLANRALTHVIGFVSMVWLRDKISVDLQTTDGRCSSLGIPVGKPFSERRSVAQSNNWWTNGGQFMFSNNKWNHAINVISIEITLYSTQYSDGNSFHKLLVQTNQQITRCAILGRA